MKVRDRVTHKHYGWAGRIVGEASSLQLRGMQPKLTVRFTVDGQSFERACHPDDLLPGEPFYPGRPTPVGAYPKVVA